MRNPAFRPAESNPEHLSRISHHLLGPREPLGESSARPATRVVPVLAAIHPTHPRGAVQPELLAKTLADALDRARAGAPDERWEAAVVEDLAAHPGAALSVVLATASVPGIRRAYARIKRQSLPRGCQLGVLTSGTDDDDLARRCRARLVEGVRRFLGTTLLDLGHAARPDGELVVASTHIADQIRARMRTGSPQQDGKEESDGPADPHGERAPAWRAPQADHGSPFGTCR